MRPDLVAFIDELGALQKEAARNLAKEDEEAKELAGAAITAAGIMGTAGSLGANIGLGLSAMKGATPGSLPVEAVAEKMGIEAPLVVEADTYAYARGSQVDDRAVGLLKAEGYSTQQIEKARRAGVILADTTRGPEFVAHELGHAANVKKNKVLSALSHRALYRPGLSAVVGGLMAVLPEDADSAVVKAAPLVPLVAQAPTLADEALASLRGFKGIKQLGQYSPQVLKKAKGNLMKAFGTYLAIAGVTTTPVAAASAYRTWGPGSGGKKSKGKTKKAAYQRGMSSLFAHAYKEDEDFRKTVNQTLSTDPNTRRRW